MIYRLSARQTKALRENGKPVIIYLPAPEVFDDRIENWAKKRLPDVADTISSVELKEAICQASGSPNKETVAGLFGVIIQEWIDEKYCYRIPVVSVRLQPPKVLRGVLGPQWPGGPMVAHTNQGDASLIRDEVVDEQP